jgi:hypothetical protein
MDGGTRSMLLAFSQVGLACGLALAEAVRRYAELSFGHAESLGQQLLIISQQPERPGAGAWDRVLAEATSHYRDYIRELAAAPGLAAMGFFEQLESLRTGRPNGSQGNPGS